MRQGRFIITTGLAALAALAMAPAVAAAAPASFVDDTDADFTAGAPGASTVVTTAGAVELVRVMKTEPFDGPGLPTGWTADAWDIPVPPASPAGTATVAGSALTLDGARVTAPRSYDVGQVMQFEATFGAASFQHVGFGNLGNGIGPTSTFSDGSWAMFSTKNTDGTVLWARTLNGPMVGGVTSETEIPLPFDPKQPHRYRIEWSTANVKYFVDDLQEPVATHPTIAGQLRPAASDFNAGGAALEIDSMGLSLHAGLGAFESRVHDAGDARTVWGKLMSLPSAIAGTEVKFETRSGNTATPDASWSAYEATAADGAIQSPSGRYIQYRATLSSSDDRFTPSLDRVELGYEIDDVGPSASLDVQVSGTTATATFSSGAADLARFECSLDAGGFATCTSPKAFSGLAAGSHTIAVRAVDKFGNAGEAASKTVSISAASGGSPPPPSSPPGGDAFRDTKAPRVTIGARSIRVSKRARIRLKCPADEVKCTIRVRLKYGRKTAGRKTAGRKTVTVAGGQKVKAKVRLSSAARRRIARRGRLKVIAIVTARDAAGNRERRTFKMTLRRS